MQQNDEAHCGAFALWLCIKFNVGLKLLASQADVLEQDRLARVNVFDSGASQKSEYNFRR